MKPAGAPLHVRVLYLFAGEHRQADMGSAFRRWADEWPHVEVSITELDILRGGSAHDLLAPELQQEILNNIESGKFEIVLATPPCSTYSRATFTRDSGPKPTRDLQ